MRVVFAACLLVAVTADVLRFERLSQVDKQWEDFKSTHSKCLILYFEIAIF